MMSLTSSSSVTPFVAHTRKRQHSAISKTSDPLHEQGFQIFQAAVKVPGSILKEANEKSTKAAAIFNHNESSKTDRKRRQCFLSAGKTTKSMKNFLESINTLISDQVSSELKPSTWVVIHSRPGCQDQAAHCDYGPSEDLANADDSEMPLSALVALMPGTKLNVWPKSIRLSTTSESDLAKVKPISCKVVELEEGDILVFRGDLVHAGSSYSEDNYRIHCFLDSDSVPRTENRTWIIGNHANETLRNIIVPKKH